MHSQTNPLNVCIIARKQLNVSETFIGAHCTRLPAETTVVSLPEGKSGVVQRGLSKTRRLLYGRTKEHSAYLIEKLQTIRPDVVLAEYGPNGVRVMEACHRLTIPLVVHFHGYDAHCKTLLHDYKHDYQRMFRTAAGLIAVSRPMRENLLQFGAPPEKVFLNAYGIACDQFAGGNPENAPPRFVACGRFTPKKAPHLTIRAFAQVRARHPEARLRMIGSGDLLAECQQLVQQLNLEKEVEFLGSQPPVQVRQEMQSALCFVQHSIEAPSGDCEGTPVAILEASATGIPTVATRHAGIPEAVLDGKTGLLVAEKDVEGMAQQMSRILADRTMAASLGNAAREHILENYETTKNLERLAGVLRHCAEHTRQKQVA